jgi:hypothetical protein
MATVSTLAAVALVALLLPLLILAWACESPQQRARRWRRSGTSYRAIAERLSISPSTARRYCLA